MMMMVALISVGYLGLLYREEMVVAVLLWSFILRVMRVDWNCADFLGLRSWSAALLHTFCLAGCGAAPGAGLVEDDQLLMLVR